MDENGAELAQLAANAANARLDAQDNTGSTKSHAENNVF